VNGGPEGWMRAWGPVALWVLVIFWLSSDTFSASATSGVLGPLLEWLLPSASEDTIYRLHVLTRKGAHLGVYAVLALLALRAARRAPALALPGSLLLALAVVACVAGADEVRQAFSSARTGALRDVGTDVLGGLAGLALGLGFGAIRALGRPDPASQSEP
jgi:VanZ family protein